MDTRRIGGDIGWLRRLLVVPLLAAGLVLGAPGPAAAAVACGDDDFDGQTITGTVKASIVVPAGQFCHLNGATVRGGVTIEAGAYLQSTGSEIRGTVEGTGINSLDLEGGVVRGDVTIAGAAAVDIASAEVRGDVEVSGAGSRATLRFSTVRAGATFVGNNDVRVAGNTIEGDLACSDNGFASNEGSPNTVGGTASGQCAGL